MSELDSLLEIIGNIKKDFKFPTDIDEYEDLDIHLVDQLNSEPVVIDIENKTGTIYVKTEEGRAIADKILREESLQGDGDFLIEREFGQEIKNLRESAPDKRAIKERKDLLQRFSKFIPTRDVQIVSDALFVRTLYEKEVNVSWYISTISTNYLSRGANICKLITSHYYEDYLEPMYEFFIKSEGRDEGKKSFRTFYEEAVTQYPFAVFVSQRRGIEPIIKEVIKKIKLNQEAEQHSLNIHGIGKQNKNKILRIIADERIKNHFISEPYIAIELESTMYARIYF